MRRKAIAGSLAEVAGEARGDAAMEFEQGGRGVACHRDEADLACGFGLGRECCDREGREVEGPDAGGGTRDGFVDVGEVALVRGADELEREVDLIWSRGGKGFERGMSDRGEAFKPVGDRFEGWVKGHEEAEGRRHS